FARYPCLRSASTITKTESLMTNKMSRFASFLLALASLGAASSAMAGTVPSNLPSDRPVKILYGLPPLPQTNRCLPGTWDVEFTFDLPAPGPAEIKRMATQYCQQLYMAQQRATCGCNHPLTPTYTSALI